jgi:hypothetical protein
MFRTFLVASLLFSIACDRSDRAAAEPSPEATPVPGVFESISCEGDVESVDVPFGEAQEVSLRAMAVPLGADPSAALNVSGQAWWTVLSGEGTVANGLYTTPNDRGGAAVIEVQLDGLSATCDLDMHLHIWIDDAQTELTAADILDQQIDENDDCAAVLVYPSRDAAFPPNQLAPEFQWLPGWFDDLFIVRIETQYVHVLATTYDQRWRSELDLLRILSRSEDGGRVAVETQLLSADYDDRNQVFDSPPCTSSRAHEIEVSNLVLPGSVVYWSPVTEGLWSIEIGATEAVPLLDPDRTGECVGCHAMNTGAPDRLSMAWGEMAVVSPLGALADPIVEPSLDRPGRFTIVDDMGDRLVRSWEGELWVDDASTGAVLGVLPTIGYATHPSINADGDRLVYSSCVSGDGWEWNMQGCELRALEADETGDWTVDRELLGRDPIWNYYYPTISPDGQWVLFNRSTGNTHDDEDAELMLLPLALEGDPIRLDRANGGLGKTNSWPRWGPVRADRAWISFSSRRRLGGNHGTPQVWLAEVDLALAWSGFDPSRAAIRLPGQDPEVGNHTPVWVPRGAGL